MKKFKFFIDFEKEENWLNDLANEGLILQSRGILGSYKFKEESDENIIIRIDYRSFRSKKDFLDYQILFQDSGWEHISGTKNSGVQYFKKVNNRVDNEIFSDNKSKALRYKRLSNMWLSLFVMYLPLLIIFIKNNIINIKALFNPKLLYYTPGLWEKTSFEFWKAFLFETPFVLWRASLWLLFPLILILYLYFAVKSRANYIKCNNLE